MALFVFFFNDTPTTEIYTLSLHDALPISMLFADRIGPRLAIGWTMGTLVQPMARRSEEHTSELQSHLNLVCRLLLEKKKYISLASGSRLCRSSSPLTSADSSSTTMFSRAR